MIPSFRFSPAQFLCDVKATADAIGAEYSESMTQTVLRAYAGSFRDGAVLWRTTDRPGDALNYRFYERRPTNSVDTAIRAGLLDPKNKMTSLISSWSSLYGDSSTELCDFDAGYGLVKTWVYLGGMRQVEGVLSAPDVPRSIRRHERRFQALGLSWVRHVAVDYRSNTANLYFRKSGKITQEESERLVCLADGKRPGPLLLLEMERFTPPDGYTFSVTMSVGNGEIQRVGFYALKLPTGQFPCIGKRLATFFRSAPSRDEEEMNAVAWSFGPDGKDYIKAERGYCGQLVRLMKTWNSPMTDAQVTS